MQLFWVAPGCALYSLGCVFQQEQLSHAETKLRLMEVTDKLDFTLGEVEILSKQLSKEKDAFQQMWVDSCGAPPGVCGCGVMRFW